MGNLTKQRHADLNCATYSNGTLEVLADFTMYNATGVARHKDNAQYDNGSFFETIINGRLYKHRSPFSQLEFIAKKLKTTPDVLGAL